MRIDFHKIVEGGAKSVSDFFGKVQKDIENALDQNGDGTLDFSDIKIAQERFNAGQEESRRKASLEALKPVFAEDFESAEFTMPKVVLVAEIDQLHAANPYCQNSVGFKTIHDDLTAITIFNNHIDSFGLTFYPEPENGVYYVDPGDRDHYISLDEYFSFMKMQRVAELQRIAQSLGAKHFRVISRDKRESSTSISVDAAVGVKYVKQGGDVKVSHDESNSQASSVVIEAEMRFPGHDPIQPELHYLKKEVNVLNLIDMRMDPLSPLQHQHFCLEMSNSSGIKEKDAVKIDALLKAMKVSASTSIVTEAKNEAYRLLEYDIEF